jgi:hypothetical protein
MHIFLLVSHTMHYMITAAYDTAGGTTMTIGYMGA